MFGSTSNAKTTPPKMEHYSSRMEHSKRVLRSSNENASLSSDLAVRPPSSTSSSPPLSATGGSCVCPLPCPASNGGFSVVAILPVLLLSRSPLGLDPFSLEGLKPEASFPPPPLGRVSEVFFFRRLEGWTGIEAGGGEGTELSMK